MNLQDLRTLLDYHYWARDRMFEALEPLTPEQASATSAAASSRSATRWRISTPPSGRGTHGGRATSPTALLTGESFADLAAIRARLGGARDEDARLCRRDSASAGVDRVFEFKMFSGQAGASPFWQMLQHVVNHASYHRGQVTNKLRQLGAQPPKSLDMIAFYRKQGLGGSGARD